MRPPKLLNVPELDTEVSFLTESPKSISALLKSGGAEERIDVISWADYPERPSVDFQIGWMKNLLVLMFSVREREILGTHLNDEESVYQDSCVEFFFSPEETDYYYNFEFSCLGTALACVGPDRRNRESIGSEALNSIRRFPSLDRRPIHRFNKGNPETPLSWSLTVVIPASAFVRDSITDFKDLNGRANFYKCGDNLERPHYLSWNPIDTPAPDYHRPEYFGRISFQTG